MSLTRQAASLDRTDRLQARTHKRRVKALLPCLKRRVATRLNAHIDASQSMCRERHKANAVTTDEAFRALSIGLSLFQSLSHYSLLYTLLAPVQSTCHKRLCQPED